MSTHFDPYLQWLGIRDPQRPPNHYRLLGLELFENDASVISMSADRQMAHLRNFKTGPEAEVAERLLNELSSARLCLLKAERKAAYDHQLRAALKPMLAPKPLSPVAPAMISVAPAVRPTVSNVRATIPPTKSAWKPWVILAGLLIVCVSLTVLLINRNSSPGDDKVAVSEGAEPKASANKHKPKPQPPTKLPEVMPVTTVSPTNTEPKSTDSSNNKTETSGKTLPTETNTIIKPLPDKATGSNNKKPPKQQPTSTNVATSPNVDPSPLLGEEVDPKIPEKPADSETPAQEPTKKLEPTLVAQVPAVEPTKPTRLVVPDKADIAAKEKEIRDIFADEYKSQKPEVKATLAAKLRQSSMESKDDSTMRYVLLNEARTNAIQGGSVKMAVELTNEIVKDYDVSDGDERFALFSKLLVGVNRDPKYGMSVVEELRNALENLQEHDEYEVALKLVNMVLPAARSLRDQALLTEMSQRSKELNLQKQSYLRAKVARETLVKNPDDPAANELWGSYLSFVKGEIETGLPFLTRGSSAELKALAARELAGKKSQSDQLELAEDWWAFGEKSQTQDSVRAIRVKQFANQKYVELYPKLTGLDKAKAEKRMAEIAKVAEIKNKRDMDLVISMLVNNKWQVFAEDGAPPEDMTFRPDGTMVNRVFQTWVVENNQLILRGGFKTGDTWTYLGKTKIGAMEFEIDYILNGKHNWYAKAKPSVK